MLTPHWLFSEISVHFAFIYFKNAEVSLYPEGLPYSLGRIYGVLQRESERAGLQILGYHLTALQPLAVQQEV